MRNWRTLLGLLVLLTVGCDVGKTPPVFFSLQVADLLQCSGFECEFREVGGVGELKVANHWEPWWSEHDVRPEYRDAAPFANRIHSGEHAQQFFNTYNKHTAGIYQQVEDVEPDRTLRFSCWIQAFSSGGDDFTKSDGRYRMRIGVDPYGGINADSGDVEWSDGGHSRQPYDAYEYVEVETAARSDRLTVFIWGQAEWRLKNNNAYVDDCELVYLDAPTPTPGPTPTGQPAGVDYERIRAIIRSELDRTKLTH